MERACEQWLESWLKARHLLGTSTEVVTGAS